MTDAFTSPLILQELPEPVAARRNIRLLLLRDDLTQPALPGNKWRKLKYNLREARHLGHNTLLTFGGAYSNHLAAVAAAGPLHGFRTVGVVRGEPTLPLNPTLAGAQAHGMQLHYLDRATYRRKTEPEVLAELLREVGPAYVIPEGGSNALALPGCAELVTELTQQTDFDYLCVACGTGGTLAGLLTGLAGTRQAIGVAALKKRRFSACGYRCADACGHWCHLYQLEAAHQLPPGRLRGLLYRADRIYPAVSSAARGSA
ncbi:1-aminocyclopropane-1-carboxylate deaminase/D-cysteine desulfhydrase [Hymenobacter sp. NBH84]|uniref:1-aminocyclopropane-1-carboxylate deaminase/D-cysteine desulfhydrase n=1 Tax=Hymenobacter sp. NBH84 TaxID=2596915 RepID=UPI002156553F|nr:pyridoxal-phosphate dependent enzyme [Hymenobacter sp. NBH84]